jgi:two-component system chemotaxis response regulator CheY
MTDACADAGLKLESARSDEIEGRAIRRSAELYGSNPFSAIEEETIPMPKVLVVEDSNVLQMYYRQIFAKLAGYHVTFTKNGRQALDHIANNGMPDVVVLDINMPVMDGLEFLGHFRGDRKTPPARVIIVTTEGREDDYKRGLDAGASAYLKKPFTPDALIELLQGLLANPIRAGANK